MAIKLFALIKKHKCAFFVEISRISGTNSTTFNQTPTFIIRLCLHLVILVLDQPLHDGFLLILDVWKLSHNLMSTYDMFVSYGKSVLEAGMRTPGMKGMKRAWRHIHALLLCVLAYAHRLMCTNTLTSLCVHLTCVLIFLHYSYLIIHIFTYLYIFMYGVHVHAICRENPIVFFCIHICALAGVLCDLTGSSPGASNCQTSPKPPLPKHLVFLYSPIIS